MRISRYEGDGFVCLSEDVGVFVSGELFRFILKNMFFEKLKARNSF